MDEQKSAAPDEDQSNGPIADTQLKGGLKDVILATGVVVFLYSVLFWFARRYNNGQELQLLVLVGIFGGAGGWIVGILASPYNSTEGSKFSELAKLVYGFLTGYVISKIDPVVNRFLDVSPGKPTKHLVYCLFAIACFMIAVTFTYIGRSYWKEKRPLAKSRKG
jgi:hypothetical protein